MAKSDRPSLPAAVNGRGQAPSGGDAEPTRSGDVVLMWPGGRQAELEASLDGLCVRHANDGASLRRALAAMRRGVVAVAVPPARDGDLEAVALARRQRPGIRVLLCNPRSAVEQRIRALTLGFDEALPDELEAAEVAARIILLERSARGEGPPVMAIGDGLVLDRMARALRRNGRLIHLRPIELRLLEELLRHAGQPVSRDLLLERIWSRRPDALSRTLDVHMRWLRQKLELDPAHPAHLLTVRGIGYQLEVGDEEGFD